MTARILIIEDDPNSMELMAYLLEAFGYIVLRAIDGLEGLQMVAGAHPDLVICDIHLPGADGYEVARRLKADPGFDTPLVAVTALAMVGDRDKVLACGFNGYIAKPIAPEAFVPQVEKFLPPGRHDAPAGPMMAAATASQDPRPRPVEHGEILAVDDVPENLHLLADMLEPYGYHVTAAAGVSEALELVRQHMPDLILCDFHLGKRTGCDLLQAIQADPAAQGIPFAFLTSTAWLTPEHKEALRLGPVTFLRRPIEAQVLLDEVKRHLRTADQNRKAT